MNRGDITLTVMNIHESLKTLNFPLTKMDPRIDQWKTIFLYSPVDFWDPC